MQSDNDPKFSKEIRESVQHARDLIDQEQYDACFKILENAKKISPDYPRVYFVLGKLFHTLNNLEEAIKSYLYTIELDNKYDYAFYNLGLIYKEEKEDFDKAIECFEAAAKLDPSDEDYNYDYASLLRKHKKDYPKAEKHYKLAIKHSEEFYEDAVYGLGLLYEITDRLEEAEHYYKQLVEFKPDNNTYLFRYARTLEEIGIREDVEKSKLALEQYNILVKRDPNDDVYINNKGTVLFHLERYEEAIKCYKKALELKPNFINYLSNIIHLLHDLGRAKEVKPYFIKLKQVLEKGIFDESITEEDVAHVKKHLVEIKIDFEEKIKKGQKLTSQEQSSYDLAAKVEMLLAAKRKHSIEIKENKKGVKKVQHEVEEVKEITDEYGATESVLLSREYKKLAKEAPELYAYANYMTGSLGNYIMSYYMMSDKVLAGQKDKDVSGEIAKSAAKKVTSITKDITNGVPIVGGFFAALNSMVNDIFDFAEEREMTNKAYVIRKIIDAKFNPAERHKIPIKIAKAAIELAKLRKDEILNPQKPDSKVAKFSHWMNERFNKVQDKLVADISLQDSIGAKKAAQDLALIMSYLFANFEDIIEDNIEFASIFSDIIKSRDFKKFERAANKSLEELSIKEKQFKEETKIQEIIPDKNPYKQHIPTEEEQKYQELQNQGSKGKGKKKCIIMSVTEQDYDNPFASFVSNALGKSQLDPELAELLLGLGQQHQPSESFE